MALGELLDAVLEQLLWQAPVGSGTAEDAEETKLSLTSEVGCLIALLLLIGAAAIGAHWATPTWVPAIVRIALVASCTLLTWRIAKPRLLRLFLYWEGRIR